MPDTQIRHSDNPSEIIHAMFDTWFKTPHHMLIFGFDTEQHKYFTCPFTDPEAYIETLNSNNLLPIFFGDYQCFFLLWSLGYTIYIEPPK